MKKRQVDFQKQKLRVGKTLPKGLNVTNTSFKAKRIITRDKTKPAVRNKTIEELLVSLPTSHAEKKVEETLASIKKFIVEHQDSLPLHFSDIVKKVGPILLRSSKKMRLLSIKLLETCFCLLSEEEFKSSFLFVSTHLHCMMTHNSFSVKQDSLIFLDRLLHTHPNVICNSSKILNSLLNLISWVDSFAKQGKSSRKLVDVMSSNMVANDWRLEVLTRVLMFLQILEKKQEVEESEVDECEAYWDGKETFTLPLYPGSGPTPAKLMYPSRVDVNTDIIDSEYFKTFLKDLVPLLSETMRGEVPGRKKVNSSEGFHIFDPYVINHLNIIAQILCCVGDSINNLGDNVDANFTLNIKNIISKQLLKNFPYAEHDKDVEKEGKKGKSECMQLNLAICYLYSMFFVEPVKDGFHKMDSQSQVMEMGEPVLRYVGNTFRSSRLCLKSLCLLLKACKNLMKSNISQSFKSGILLGMYDILEARKFSQESKLLFSFFMDLSLNYEFKYLLNTEGMSTWFKLLIKELSIIKESNLIDKRFLKYVRQVCTRRYSSFMELLNQMETDKILELLVYDNEEFQLTIAHLIVSLEKITPDFLQDLTDMMRQKTFSVKTTVRMIHLLHARFSNSNVSEVQQLFFVQFLLNLGCDTLSFGEQYPEFHALPLHSVLKSAQNSLQFELCPSKLWEERHKTIYQACADCLAYFINRNRIADYIMLFLKSTLLNNTVFSIHSAIAFLDLRKQIPYCYHDSHLPNMFYELILSSFVYVSVITKALSEEGLGLYSVPELLTCLTSEAPLPEASKILEIFSSNLSNASENYLFHILRVLMFMGNSKLVSYSDQDAIYDLLYEMNPCVGRSRLLLSMFQHISSIYEYV